MRHTWHPHELALRRELYPHVPTRDVAALIGCTTASAYNKANTLGLKKTAQVRMCGNSVCPPLSRAIVSANYSELQELREAA